jgi:hypothetical protein
MHKLKHLFISQLLALRHAQATLLRLATLKSIDDKVHTTFAVFVALVLVPPILSETTVTLLPISRPSCDLQIYEAFVEGKREAPKTLV